MDKHIQNDPNNPINYVPTPQQLEELQIKRPETPYSGGPPRS